MDLPSPAAGTRGVASCRYSPGASRPTPVSAYSMCALHIGADVAPEDSGPATNRDRDAQSACRRSAHRSMPPRCALLRCNHEPPDRNTPLTVTAVDVSSNLPPLSSGRCPQTAATPLRAFRADAIRFFATTVSLGFRPRLRETATESPAARPVGESDPLRFLRVRVIALTGLAGFAAAAVANAQLRVHAPIRSSRSCHQLAPRSNSVPRKHHEA